MSWNDLKEYIDEDPFYTTAMTKGGEKNLKG